MASQDGQSAPREPRLRLDGKVRLMIAFEPWRLLLTLTGQDISASGVRAVLEEPFKRYKGAKEPSPQLTSESLLADAERYLEVGDVFDLQIEHESTSLPVPFVHTRLVRRQKSSQGLELAFRFEDAQPDLLSLVHELKTMKSVGDHS